MSTDSPLESDLVRDSRLPTNFLPDGGIQHTLWRSSRPGGRRRSKKDEIWRRISDKQLGRGSFGQVWLERSGSGRVRALKTIQKGDHSSAINYARELEAAAKFSHDRYVDCFVESYGWFEDDQHIYLAMEYLEHGDLGRFLDKPFREKEAKDITFQLVQGLNHMHENKFVHRDLKPQNILVAQPGPRWWVKIADFGISKRAKEGTNGGSTAIGTERYCAPEVFCATPSSTPRDEPFEQSCRGSRDLWALGEVLFRMLSSRPAFESSYNVYRFAEGHETFDAKLKLLSSQGLSHDCSNFVAKLLIADPKTRMTASEASEHPWLQSAAIPSPSSSRSSTPSFQEESSLQTLSTNLTNDASSLSPDAALEGSVQWSTASLDNTNRALIPNSRSSSNQTSLEVVPRMTSPMDTNHPPRQQATERRDRRRGDPETSSVKPEKAIQQEKVAPDESTQRHLAKAARINEEDARNTFVIDYNNQSFEIPPRTMAVFSDLGISLEVGDSTEGKKTRRQLRTTPNEARPVRSLSERKSISTFNSVYDDEQRSKQQPNYRLRRPRPDSGSASYSDITSQRSSQKGSEAFAEQPPPEVQIRQPAVRRLLEGIHRFGEPTPTDGPMVSGITTLKLFYCTHPFCNENDPNNMLKHGHSPAFWSLNGLLDHIFTLHHSRATPCVIGNFICIYAHSNGPTVSVRSNPTFPHLVHDVLQHLEQGNVDLNPVFSWGYLADSRIWIGAFSSFYDLVRRAAAQYFPPVAPQTNIPTSVTADQRQPWGPEFRPWPRLLEGKSLSKDSADSDRPAKKTLRRSRSDKTLSSTRPDVIGYESHPIWESRQEDNAPVPSPNGHHDDSVVPRTTRLVHRQSIDSRPTWNPEPIRRLNSMGSQLSTVPPYQPRSSRATAPFIPYPGYSSYNVEISSDLGVQSRPRDSTERQKSRLSLRERRSSTFTESDRLHRAELDARRAKYDADALAAEINAIYPRAEQDVRRAGGVYDNVDDESFVIRDVPAEGLKSKQKYSEAEVYADDYNRSASAGVPSRAGETYGPSYPQPDSSETGVVAGYRSVRHAASGKELRLKHRQARNR